MTFASETAPGWQQMDLPTAVAITANITYVASYHTTVGYYAVTIAYFAGTSVANPPLRAVADGMEGGNGVYKYGTSGFPTQTLNANNYWVDVVFTATAPPPPPSPPYTGLVAAYSFDEGSGTSVTDASGNGNHGTVSGARWITSGRFGKALRFDGVNDWVSVADSASLDLTTGMTLEAWVYPTELSGGSANGWRTVILKEQPGHLV